MARKNEAAELLIEGHSIPEIAEQMGISLTSIIQYLCTVVGEGRIQRSDIFFSISPDKRKAIERTMGDSKECEIWKAQRILEEEGYESCREELEVFLMLQDKDALLGDMYDNIRKIELILHDMIKTVLVVEFGDDWWREGIPEKIRKACVLRREEERGMPVLDPYSYTTFIHLKGVIDDKWKLFARVLPSGLAHNKKELLRQLDRTNSIRNAVMHPVKKIPLTEDDFCFVHDFQKQLDGKKWRL